MRKNKIMRFASLILVLTLLSTSVISGTFAKYTTSVESEDKARVAYWGFQSSNSMDLKGLFSGTYNNVDAVNDDDVIAPGTEGSTTFAFAWDESTSAYGTAVAVTGPEVAYDFTVAVVDTCDDLIKANKNIQWKLDTGAWGTWDQMVAAIKALSGEASGSKEYAPNTLPAAFTKDDDIHTISWQWIFNETESGTDLYDTNGDSTADMTQDEYDTYMGNAAELDDCSIKITITATQKD